jgi:hypothetical protein
MVILIAVVLCVGLLYFWLVGHWFARVLVFLALMVLFGMIAFATMNAVLEGVLRDPLPDWWRRTPKWIMPVSVLLGLVIGPVAGWFASMIPTYYWRHRGVMRARFVASETNRVLNPPL